MSDLSGNECFIAKMPFSSMNKKDVPLRLPFYNCYMLYMLFLNYVIFH